MREKSFPLEPGGAPRLGVSWRGGFKDLSASFDGAAPARFVRLTQLAEYDAGYGPATS